MEKGFGDLLGWREGIGIWNGGEGDGWRGIGNTGSGF